MAERLRGYRDALEAHPQIKITRVVDIKGDPRIAFDTTTKFLGKKKTRSTPLSAWRRSRKRVATVLNSNGVTKKIVVAMDTDPTRSIGFEKASISATISQKPYTMSYVGLKMLDDLYHHKLASLDKTWANDSFAPIPAFVDTGSALIDKRRGIRTSQQIRDSKVTHYNHRRLNRCGGRQGRDVLCHQLTPRRKQKHVQNPKGTE